MNAVDGTFFKAVIASVPVGTMLVWSVALWLKRRTVWSAVQLAGSVGLAVVVIAHICEGLHLFPWFGWGDEHSVGHYVDLSSAILGVTLLPLGYFLHRRERLLAQR